MESRVASLPTSSSFSVILSALGELGSITGQISDVKRVNFVGGLAGEELEKGFLIGCGAIGVELMR